MFANSITSHSLPGGEATLAAASSPDQSVIACWTNKQLHVCTVQPSIDSVARIELSPSTSVDGLKSVLWRPSNDGLIAIASESQLIIVRLVDTNKDRRPGWIEWFLTDSGTSDDASESSSDSLPSMPPAWTVKVVATMTAQSGTAFTAITCTENAILLGTDGGNIICANWAAELACEVALRNALGVTSGSTTSASVRTPACSVAALAASGEGAVVAAYADGGAFSFSLAVSPRIRVLVESITVIAEPSHVSEAVVAPTAVACLVSGTHRSHGSVLPAPRAATDETSSSMQSATPSQSSAMVSAAIGYANGTVAVFIASAPSTSARLNWHHVTSVPAGDASSDVLSASDGIATAADAITPAASSASQQAAPSAHTHGVNRSSRVVSLSFRESSPFGLPTVSYPTARASLAAVVGPGPASPTSLAAIWTFSLTIDAQLSLSYAGALSSLPASSPLERASIMWTNAGHSCIIAPSLALGASASSADAGSNSSSSSLVDRTEQTATTEARDQSLSPDGLSALSSAGSSGGAGRIPNLLRIDLADPLASKLCDPSAGAAAAWAITPTSLYLVDITPTMLRANGNVTRTQSKHLLKVAPTTDGSVGPTSTPRKTKQTSSPAGATTPTLASPGAACSSTANATASSPSALASCLPAASSELGDVTIGWKRVQVSSHYVPAQAPLRCSAVTSDGARVAVAGTRGLAIYHRPRHQWHVFSRPREERQVCARALCWALDRVLLVVHEDEEQRLDTHRTPRATAAPSTAAAAPAPRLQAYTHAHLDFESRLFDVELPIPAGHALVAMSTGQTNVIAHFKDAAALKGMHTPLPCVVPWVALASAAADGAVTITIVRLAVSDRKDVDSSTSSLSNAATAAVTATLGSEVAEDCFEQQSDGDVDFGSTFNGVSSVPAALRPMNVASAAQEASSSTGSSSSAVTAASSARAGTSSLCVANAIKADAATGRVTVIPEEVPFKPTVKGVRPEVIARFALPGSVVGPNSDSVSGIPDLLASLSIVSCVSDEVWTGPEGGQEGPLTVESVVSDAIGAPKKKSKILTSSSAPALWTLLLPDIMLHTAAGGLFVLHGRSGAIRKLRMPGQEAVTCAWQLPASTYGLPSQSGTITAIQTASNLAYHLPSAGRHPSHLDQGVLAQLLMVSHAPHTTLAASSSSASSNASAMSAAAAHAPREQRSSSNAGSLTPSALAALGATGADGVPIMIPSTPTSKPTPSGSPRSDATMPYLLNPLPFPTGLTVSAAASQTPFSAAASSTVLGLLPQHGGCAVLVSAGARIVCADDGSTGDKAAANLASLVSPSAGAALVPTHGLLVAPTLPCFLEAVASSKALSATCSADDGAILKAVSAGVANMLSKGSAHVRSSLRTYLLSALEAEAVANASPATSALPPIIIGGVTVDMQRACSGTSVAILRTLGGALKTYMQRKGFRTADVAALLEGSNSGSATSSLGSRAASSSLGPKSVQLASALSLLRSAGPYCFLGTVTGVGRTIDEDRLPMLFPTAGNPRDLFNQALQQAEATSIAVAQLPASGAAGAAPLFATTIHKHNTASARYLRTAAATMLLVQEYAWRQRMARDGSTSQPATSATPATIVAESLADACALLRACGLSQATVKKITTVTSSSASNDAAAAVQQAKQLHLASTHMTAELLSLVRSELIAACEPDVAVVSGLLQLVDTVRAYCHRLNHVVAPHDTAGPSKTSKAVTTSTAAEGSTSAAGASPVPSASTPPPKAKALQQQQTGGWSILKAAANFFGIGDEEETGVTAATDATAAESLQTGKLAQPNFSSSAAASTPSKPSTASAAVKSDAILRHLLSTMIPVLGRYETVVTRNAADGSFGIEAQVLDREKLLVASSDAASATAAPAGANPSGGDLDAVMKATTDIIAAQRSWQRAQTLDLSASIHLHHPNQGQAQHAAAPGAAVAIKDGDLPIRVEGQPVFGLPIHRVKHALAVAPRDTHLTLLRLLSIPVLQVLLAMGE